MKQWKIIKSNDSKSIVGTFKPTLCSFYQHGNCNKGNVCAFLHICKEYLVINGSCSKKHCRKGLSHNLFDENNKRIISPNYHGASQIEILSKLRETFSQDTKFTSSGNAFKVNADQPVICSFYLKGTCNKGISCSFLHICKDYLLTVAACPKKYCTKGFSHNIFDEHNKRIITPIYRGGSQVEILSKIRESVSKDTKFTLSGNPDICSFYLKGTCTKSISCGFLHICKDYLVNVATCPKERCTKGFSHSLFDEHNKRIISPKVGSNHGEVLCELRESFSKETRFTKLVVKDKTIIERPIICSFYQNGNCKKNNLCSFLHLCKEFLVDNNCTNEICKKGLSHNLLDEHNKTLLLPKFIGNAINQDEILNRLRKSFPQICANYNIGKCSSDDCLRLHVCPEFVTNNCYNGNCEFSHNLKDENNSKIFESFKLQNLLAQKDPNFIKANIVTNILESSVNNEPKKEDIIAYILNKNPQEGSCSLDDKQLLSFFDDQNADLVQNWFKKNSSSFRLATNASNKTVIHICLVNVEPCQLYWEAVGCSKKQCGKFHICKMLLYKNHNANSCNSNHDFQAHEIPKLIKINKLHRFSDEQVVTLLRNRYPFVCTNYQNGTCVETAAFCTKLHICKDFAVKKCNKSEQLCGLEHEAALEGEQGIRLAKSFHITQGDEFLSCLMPENTTIVGSTKTTGAVGFNSSKNEGICLSYVNGYCPKKKLCNLKHVQSPYIWQCKKSGDVWKSVSDVLNEAIEKHFCNPSNDRAYIIDLASPISFQSMSLEGVFTDTQNIYSYRRLATKSSVLETNKLAGTTTWKWFWEEAINVWKEYSIGITSDILEKLYVNSSISHTFTSGQFSYKLSFDTMVQQNQDERYSTIRRIKRRPLFQTNLAFKRNASELCLLPSTWPKLFKPGDLIDVSPSKLSELSTKFAQSMTRTVHVIKIQEVCNEEFYERYEYKKKAMSKLNQGGEKFLYHGTANDTVQHIRVQNFDFRVCGKNATAFGKGSYFSENAAYSHNYCSPDSHGYYYMFVAQVLTGRFTQGNSTYNRPPPIQAGSLELYDSCVDNVSKPTMYIIFERDQCYPRYLITYR